MRNKSLYIILLSILTLSSCKYNLSFSGINIAKNIKTFEIGFISNNAPIIVPGLGEDFRNQLIDRIGQQTNLTQEKSGGDLVFNLEITDYVIAPKALTANETASQNRLTIKIKLDYVNAKNEKDDFRKTYSYFYDFSATQSISSIRDEAHKVIFEHVLDDIFNDTLAKW